jgi:hypothetical protein
MVLGFVQIITTNKTTNHEHRQKPMFFFNIVPVA